MEMVVSGIHVYNCDTRRYETLYHNPSEIRFKLFCDNGNSMLGYLFDDNNLFVVNHYVPNMIKILNEVGYSKKAYPLIMNLDRFHFCGSEYERDFALRHIEKNAYPLRRIYGPHMLEKFYGHI